MGGVGDGLAETTQKNDDDQRLYLVMKSLHQDLVH